MNIRYFQSFIVSGVLLLFFVIRDTHALGFVLMTLAMYILNEYFTWVSYICEIVVNFTATICYSCDHYQFDPNEHRTHVRAYIYVACTFAATTISSYNWQRSTFVYLLSNLLLIYNLKIHFTYLSSEYYIVMLTTLICLGVTLYLMEAQSRKTYMMYKKMQILERKQNTILKLFPECLVIVDLNKRDLQFYNEEF